MNTAEWRWVIIASIYGKKKLVITGITDEYEGVIMLHCNEML